MYWSSCWNNDGSPLLCGAWEKCRTVLDHTIFVYILIHFIILELVRVRRFFRGDYRVCRRRNKIYLRISILQCSVVSVLSAVICVFRCECCGRCKTDGSERNDIKATSALLGCMDRCCASRTAGGGLGGGGPSSNTGKEPTTGTAGGSLSAFRCAPRRLFGRGDLVGASSGQDPPSRSHTLLVRCDLSCTRR